MSYALVLDLKDEFILEMESDMSGFLGLHMVRSKEGEVVLSQIVLINRIVLMVMEGCNHKYTNVDKIPVGKDVDGDPCMDEWE